MQTSFKNSVNKTRVLEEIWKTKGISRIEISQRLGLNKSTITKITNDLFDSKLINDYKKIDLESSAGRKRVGLEINLEYGSVIGLEIETESYKAVVVDLYGKVLNKYTGSLKDNDLLISIKTILDSIIKKTEERGIRIIGIGIGLSGSVDPNSGILIRSNPLNIDKEIDLYKYLYNEYNYPVFIENDANCCSYGELTFNRGDKDNNFIFALGEYRLLERNKNSKRGIAIGLGIVINGKVIHGDNFTAGEFKSLFWKRKNKSQFSTDSEVMDSNLLREFLRHISLFINTFNFTKVIFSGLFNNCRDEINKILKEEISQNWLYTNDPKVKIEYSTFEEYSVAYGAAGMVIKNFFTTPKIEKVTKKSDLRGVDLLKGV